MKKATTGFSSGLWIKFPKVGFAPALFMEWASSRIGQVDMKFIDRNDHFMVRMGHFLRETYDEARDYINVNLPE